MEPWYKAVLPRKEVREGRSFNPDAFKAGSENEKKINEHPAILWKVVNVRNQLAKLSKRKKAGPFRTV